jgi:hypothetical protein
MAVTYTPIATTTVTTATASYTFSSIPSTYTDLILVSNARSTRSATDDSLYMRVNSDTATNYSVTTMKGNGSSAQSDRSTSISSAYVALNINASSTTSSTFTPVLINLMNYSSTSTYKTFLSRESYTAEVAVIASLWRSTAAISTIQVFCAIGNIEVGTTFTLYGVKAA